MSAIDSFTRDDRVGHETLGFAVGATSAAIVERWQPTMKPLERMLIEMAPVVIVAIGKELLDARHPARHDADPIDAVATTLGGGAGVLLINVTLRW